MFSGCPSVRPYENLINTKSQEPLGWIVIILGPGGAP